MTHSMHYQLIKQTILITYSVHVSSPPNFHSLRTVPAAHRHPHDVGRSTTRWGSDVPTSSSNAHADSELWYPPSTAANSRVLFQTKEEFLTLVVGDAAALHVVAGHTVSLTSQHATVYTRTQFWLSLDTLSPPKT